MKSTIEKPLAFFVYVTSYNGFMNVLDTKLYSRFEKILKIDSEKSNVSGVETDGRGEYYEEEYSFKDFLVPTLRREFETSKSLMYDFCIHNPEKAENYLKVQFNIIQNAIRTNHELVGKYPFLLLPINGLVKYMNNVLLTSNRAIFKLEIGKVDTADVKREVEITEFRDASEIINDVLGYLQGQNEKREQILSADDFQLLIEYTTDLVTNDKNVKSVSKKLKPKISTELLRFSYWVLHKELYTTKRIHPCFLDFLKTVFKNFENVELTTIAKNFGKKTAISHDHFIPVSIKKHL